MIISNPFLTPYWNFFAPPASVVRMIWPSNQDSKDYAEKGQ
jgi:hypothetical protein